MAESFGVDPERYDRTRAEYPEAMIERIVSASPGPGFLDVGCGTGIEARQFRAAGRTVLGVEPDRRMAGFARRTGLDVEVATFEEWEPAGRTFDAVVSGTAWHWVDPVAGAAKAARVLRPGGVLAPFGHVYQLPPALADALHEAYRRVAPDSPLSFTGRPEVPALDAYQGLYARAAEGIREAGGFDEPELWRHDWQRTYSREELLDLVPTSGGLTTLPPERLAEVVAALGTAVDGMGGTVTLPYATWGLTARRSELS
ncbi:class I SAM-dependent methyltransferase [Lentzea flaviverrucosa]|uniref:Ubiquinone/menaquinone biosynthesis C-methylase UbiE n=1 Tax=Lentzea flaviverrucosa TaxID=200379 RepID=A0A1H9GW75_9PSEU|nr:class I SAM-dependent methyltransferase [Lentzea flaviverrucosa]RDI34780.1 ubiquinone/menaquinone biosynthesis C-methylase UbiE [Lentzea flaviverrucosa]SEQ54319.1 Ubiquinone/menaquinone biosynthesis C-methylase UbiE [Lentzea flaviverrucosa]